MKRVFLLLVFGMLLAAHAASVDQNPPEQIGAASKDLLVMARRGVPDENPDGGLAVWVQSHKSHADLPPSPLAIEGEAEGNSWSLPIPPDVAFSPNAQWLFAAQKVCTGYRIGYLYRRGEGLHFAIATKTRFDALAWRFFGKTEGVNVETLIASDSPAHLIDFVKFDDRYLAVSLRGAIGNLPASKSVVSNPKNSDGATGIYDWQCVYDLKEGRFVLPATMRAYDSGAWRRWAGTATKLWNADIESELNTGFRALLAKLDPAGQKKLREEQGAWLKRRDEVLKNPDSDPVDFTRERAVELQLRLLVLG